MDNNWFRSKEMTTILSSIPYSSILLLNTSAKLPADVFISKNNTISLSLQYENKSSAVGISDSSPVS